MNNNIYIDTKVLYEEIEKIICLNKEIEDLKNSLENKTNELKDYWNTRTSNIVYDEFINFNKKLENYILKNNEYINFLKQIVSENYTNIDEVINNLVDSNISVS